MSTPSQPDVARLSPRAAIQIVLRGVFTSALLLLAYFIIPLNDLGSGPQLLFPIFVVLAVVGLMGWQIYAISNSEFPALRAVEAVVVTLPLYLLVYSAIYVATSSSNPAAFSESLSHVDGLYFTVTTFATVGYGDITPLTPAARLTVTGQMVLNLLLLGVGVRVVVNAVSRSRSRHGPVDDLHTRQSG